MKHILLNSIIGSNLILKLVHSRASQFISGIVGYAVGKALASDLVEKIKGMPSLVELLEAIGIPPTEAGLTLVFTTLAWALYNLIMTLLYGAKFKEIQHAHGLAEDRWAGPLTMRAAKKGGIFE